MFLFLDGRQVRDTAPMAGACTTTALKPPPHVWLTSV
jgi:hypothetical protein